MDENLLYFPELSPTKVVQCSGCGRDIERCVYLANRTFSCYDCKQKSRKKTDSVRKERATLRVFPCLIEKEYTTKSIWLGITTQRLLKEKNITYMTVSFSNGRVIIKKDEMGMKLSTGNVLPINTREDIATGKYLLVSSTDTSMEFQIQSL